MKTAYQYLDNQLMAHAYSGITTETLEITPDLAAYILNYHNVKNRSVRRRRVSELARVIKNGKWRLTSQGISFSRDGILNNGQHRLAACVEANISILLRVTWGEEADVFDVLDTGALRTAGDALQSLGYKNVNELGAISRLSHYMSTGVKTVRNDQVVNIIENNSAFDELSNLSCNISKKFKASSAGILYALAQIETKSKRAHDLRLFCSQLSEGAMLPKHSPILALREGLINKRFDAGIRDGLERSEAISACFIKAWNGWVIGADIKLLRFNKNNEQFPTPR
tara:strand:+ start:12643 stop:13491 length:849 start_codon:yes stop_codon:yes gene_type:complete